MGGHHHHHAEEHGHGHSHTKVKPSQTFTYGYKKSTILAALVNAVILLIAIGILGYEAISRLRNPQPMEGGVIAWVAGLGIIVNGVSAFLFFRNKTELNARSAYLHLLADTMVSVGVAISGIVIIYTSWYWLDTVVSLAVLIVILIGTWSLLTDSLRLSLDAVPRAIDPAAVENAIRQVEGVAAVSHIHIWALSTTENALTAHILLRGDVEDQHLLVGNIRHALIHENIHHATIEVDKGK
jgi:cobalt-zinc-cadmium efflux system protein